MRGSSGTSPRAGSSLLIPLLGGDEGDLGMRVGDREMTGLVLALAVGGLLFAFLDEPNLPSRCADGWRSPSIGATGACAHHAGVVPGRDPTPWWKRALPVGAGLVIFLVPAWRNGAFRRQKHDPTAEFKDPVSLEILQAMEDGSDLRFLYTKERQDPQWRTVSPIGADPPLRRQSSLAVRVDLLPPAAGQAPLRPLPNRANHPRRRPAAVI